MHGVSGVDVLPDLAPHILPAFPRSGGKGLWEDRMFSIVTAVNATLAQLCGLYDPQANTDLFLSTATPAFLEEGEL